MLAGKSAIEAGNYPAAERIYIAAMAMCGGSDYQLGVSLGQLGSTLIALGRQADATRTLRRSIALLQEQPQPASAELALFWQSLGSSLYYQHRYSDAEHAYNEALELTTGTGDRAAIAHLFGDLGSLYESEGRYEEARAALDRAGEALDPTTEEGRFLEVSLLNDTGVLCRVEGRHGDAERAFRKAADGLNGIHDPDGLLTVAVLHNLAFEQMAGNRYEAAAAVLADVVDRMAKAKPIPIAERIEVLRHYRECLQKSGRKSELKPLDVEIKLLLANPDTRTVDVSELHNERADPKHREARR